MENSGLLQYHFLFSNFHFLKKKSKMKIAVIGANGQLVTEICKLFASKHKVIPLTHHDIEIADVDSVKKVFGEMKPEVVVCTAAAHNVPKCESEPDVAFRING